MVVEVVGGVPGGRSMAVASRRMVVLAEREDDMVERVVVVGCVGGSGSS